MPAVVSSGRAPESTVVVLQQQQDDTAAQAADASSSSTPHVRSTENRPPTFCLPACWLQLPCPRLSVVDWLCLPACCAVPPYACQVLSSGGVREQLFAFVRSRLHHHLSAAQVPHTTYHQGAEPHTPCLPRAGSSPSRPHSLTHSVRLLVTHRPCLPCVFFISVY